MTWISRAGLQQEESLSFRVLGVFRGSPLPRDRLQERTLKGRRSISFAQWIGG